MTFELNALNKEANDIAKQVGLKKKAPRPHFSFLALASTALYLGSLRVSLGLFGSLINRVSLMLSIRVFSGLLCLLGSQEFIF